MAELKTKPSSQSVEKFLASITDEQRRADSRAMLKIMKEITKAPPKMWGPSIVGFGTFHYKYASGREGDWLVTGFSPRKTALTLYIMDYLEGYEELLAKLGKHTTGKSCLYIKNLDDVHLPTLKKLIKQSVARLGKKRTS